MLLLSEAQGSVMDSNPLTLGDLQDRELGLDLECQHCHRRVRVFRDQFVARHGRRITLSNLGARARCVRCTHIGATVRLSRASTGLWDVTEKWRRTKANRFPHRTITSISRARDGFAGC